MTEEELCIEGTLCSGCEHIVRCKNEYGNFNKDGDDYRAVLNTHFCLKSWEGCGKHNVITGG
jgi:hypothetical protein